MNVFTPTVIAMLALLMAALLAVMGVYLLVGLGWSLIAGAVALSVLAMILFRGIYRAQQISG